MGKSTKVKLAALSVGAVLAANTLFGSFAFADSGASISKGGKWVAGDFHTHTFLTDGSNTEKEVVQNAFEKYGLDWMANSEHGGTSKRDPYGNNFASPTAHADAVAGAKWLEDNYKDASYFILNHPSRVLKYSIADIRDFNNAAPDVAFGFEGIPGHQKESDRGGYSSSNDKARTYGGADYMIAKVGGLWDALLGEGRHFWTFANSDFHNTGGDFWPGEYEKNYTLVNGNDYKSLVAGFKSGNSFAVEGDLINGLEFSAKSKDNAAVMGQELNVKKGDNAQITIRFKSPKTNNNGDTVKVDHIDLIAGDVTGKVASGTPEYTKDTNESTKVIASFTQKDWENEDGWYEIKYNLKNVNKNQYFRLRGTNLGLGITNQTDGEGNPLLDKLIPNNAGEAYKDMWFYSNPVFVSVE